MAQHTAMQKMYEELMAHEYTIPISLIVKCKELIEVEKDQIEQAFIDGDCGYHPDNGTQERMAKEYYNETFTQGNE